MNEKPVNKGSQAKKADSTIHTIKEIYEFYKQQWPETKIEFKQFKEILSTYNQKVGEAIIQGDTWNMGSGIGYIAARRIERNHSKPVVNWAETNKIPRLENGKFPYLVYYEDDYYYRIGWCKNNNSCRVKNLSMYVFRPAKGRPASGRYGFKDKFVLAIKGDPILGLTYQYFPYKKLTKEELDERDKYGI